MLKLKMKKFSKRNKKEQTKLKNSRNSLKKNRARYHVEEAEERSKLLGEKSDQEDWTFIEVLETEILSEKEEVIDHK